MARVEAQLRQRDGWIMAEVEAARSNGLLDQVRQRERGREREGERGRERERERGGRGRGERERERAGAMPE